MLKKYIPLLPGLIGCIVFFFVAISSKGMYMYIFYGLAIAMLLILIWQLVSLAAETRKPDNVQNRDS